MALLFYFLGPFHSIHTQTHFLPFGRSLSHSLSLSLTVSLTGDSAKTGDHSPLAAALIVIDLLALTVSLSDLSVYECAVYV